MVNSSEILDIIEIISFTPAFFVSLYVCSKHGFSRESGWLLLTILATVRIAGGATGLAGQQEGNTGIIIASLVLSSIGSATLVAALTGVVNRLESGSHLSRLPPRARKLLQVIGIVAIVMGSIGASKVPSSDPSTRADGYTYLKVAAIMILLQFLATAYLLILQLTHMRQVLDIDRRLCFAATAAAPFVFVRTIYSVCAAFNPTSSAFNTYSHSITAIILRGVLAVSMEIVATGFLLVGGFVAPRIQKRETPTANDIHLEPYRQKEANLP